MKIHTVFKKHPEIFAEFKRRATPETPSLALVEWLRSLPECAGSYIGDDLSQIRRRYKCQAKAGGARPGRGQRFYCARLGRRPRSEGGVFAHTSAGKFAKVGGAN